MGLMHQIGANIRAVRKAMGMLQSDLAEMVNLSRTSVTNIEKGRQEISITRLTDIATALNVSAAALLQSVEENPMRKEPNPSAPEGVEKPDPPPGPPQRSLRELQAAKLIAETEALNIKNDKLRGLMSIPDMDTPPIFNNPTAQRAYEALMADANRREGNLKSSYMNPNDEQQFMLDAHALALRTAYEISMEGIRAINDTAKEIDSTEGK